MQKQNFLHRALIGAALATAATVAQAHPGHGIGTVLEDAAHPLGVDRLLALGTVVTLVTVVAVGLGSVARIPAARAWARPAAFVAGAIGFAGAAVYLLSQI